MSNLQRIVMIHDAIGSTPFLNGVFDVRRSEQIMYKKITK
jgi:hypothetical protein